MRATERRTAPGGSTLMTETYRFTEAPQLGTGPHGGRLVRQRPLMKK
jgi:hypothetical protein